MKRIVTALLLLPLVGLGASAQTTGDAAAGKAYWDREAPNPTACRNCHGPQGQGAFGPDLAGRGLSAAQVLRAVRKPWGIMPAFVESQLSDQQAADLAAYFASLPKVAEPGKWRFEVPAGASPGQAMLINIGCAQCHGPTFNGPRGNLGAVNASFDEFTNLVYNHTTALPQLRASLGNKNPNIDMGNYVRTRVTEGMLRQIYFWARDEIGFRVPMRGQIAKGEAGPSGVTYAVTVGNGGLQGKGVIAEGVTVALNIPADTQVVAATGTGYQGVHTDEKTKGNVAVWKLPRSAPKDEEKLTITLSKAATASDNLHGNIRWAKPAPKDGPSTDVVDIAPAPL
ncbi:MAG TPA: cytochrome c [Xanthobacteraceae bacterium]|nr:cytochrome c [Xanthobacteraceae bacterium]